MRILFDSKQPQFKSPFGVLTPGQVCTLHVHIPTSVCTRRAEIVLCYEDGNPARYLEMQGDNPTYSAGNIALAML